MAPFTHGLGSHSSSISLSMGHSQEALGGRIDDMSIAKGLLARPAIPRRRTSFSGTLLGKHSLNTLRMQDRSIETDRAERSRRAMQSSNTWTSSSGHVPSEHDEVDDREIYVEEYNRLTRKHGLRMMVLEDYGDNDDSTNVSTRPASWFTRKILRRTSSMQSVKPLKHKRSISDLSLRLKAKKDKLKDKDLQELVRLCGCSLLYLPAEYTSGSLTVPTCFRATAQYLVQHAPAARGVFRIPGAHNVVEALYNYFCSMDEDGDAIAGTVRCPTLPDHIRCDVHDVASVYKRFLAGLPGGILGSLPLFDALVAIQGQLHGDAEFTRTKQTKLRARLIALAISTLKSQYRRELICSVFGLLCMVGRASETTRREDEWGRPLPTSDLMGYSALGIVFGPLLVGDLLDNQNMHLANPHGGLVLLPISSPKSRKEKKTKRAATEEGTSFNSQVDKVKVANGITEMLVTHWRDVVRHMKSLGSILKTLDNQRSLMPGMLPPAPFLRPSVSETFALRKPPDWDEPKPPARRNERSESPTPASRIGDTHELQEDESQNDATAIRKHRSKPRPKSSQLLSGARSLKILSPTVEEVVETPGTNTASIKDLLGDTDGAKSRAFKIKERKATPSFKDNPSKQSKKERKDAAKLSGNKSNPANAEFYAIGNPFSSPDKSPETPTKVGKRQRPSKPRSSRRGKHSFSLFDYSAGKGIQHTPLHHLDLRLPNTDFHTPECLNSRRVVSSEPANTKKVYVHDSRRMAKSGIPMATLPSAFSSNRMKFNKDPLTKVSQEEDLASLAELGKVLKDTAKAQNIEAETEARQQAHQLLNQSSLACLSHEEDTRSLTELSEAMMENESTGLKPSAKSPHVSNTKTDPLSHVSHEEDIESLVTLSKAIANDGTKHESSDRCGVVNRKQVGSSSQGAVSQRVGEQSQNSASPGKIMPERPINVASSLGSHPFRPFDKSSALHASSKKEPCLDAGRTRKGTFGFRSSPSKAPNDHDLEPKTPKKPLLPFSGSVKALAERFNNPSPSKQSNLSPTKSHRKSISADSQSLIPVHTPRRDSVIAAYTTNNSSPAKSYKSEISAKSAKTTQPRVPQRIRKPIPVNKEQKRHEKEQGPVKPSPPRRILIPSLEETKYLRPTQAVRKSFEAGDDRAGEFAVNSFNPFAMPLKSVAAMPRVKTYDGHGSIPSDGPRAIVNIETVLPAPEPPQVAQFMRPSRPSSTTLDDTVNAFGESLKKVSPISREPSLSITNSGSPFPRSNSILHSQIRNLQTKIDEKNEDVRKLRQQLEAIEAIDVGVLSEQLRNSKRETQIWQGRALTAEKKVELFSKISQRQSIASVSERAVNLFRTNTDSSNSSGGQEKRSRVSVRGMDGAAASWNSQDSSGTIVKEAGETDDQAQQRVFNMWMKQAMERLDSSPV